jgi:hypothetical protein
MQTTVGDYVKKHNSYTAGIFIVGLLPLLGLFALLLIWPKSRESGQAT